MLPKGGEVDLNGVQNSKQAAQYRLESIRPGSPASKPDIKGWQYFAGIAEAAGIDSVLISFSRYEPDPFVIACALGLLTQKLKFIIAFRTGLQQPASFVQQVNTLSLLIHGRLSLNVVAGSSKMEQEGYGDFLDHDERYARAEEFLKLCNAFWTRKTDINFGGLHYKITKGQIHTSFFDKNQTRPDIFVSGHSEPALHLAISQATCWLRVIDTPEKLAPVVKRLREQGIEVCLRLAIICRPAREEVVNVINEILSYLHEAKPDLRDKQDSQMHREAATSTTSWLSPTIWAGFVPFCGPVWTTLAGTPGEVAAAILSYKAIGVSQFIISGWPEINELEIFANSVLPIIRASEA
jgi:alkanesulfonate monooxygenase